MKHLLILLLAVGVVTSNAQDITLPTDENKKITYTGVIELSGATPDILRAKAHTFLKSEKNVSGITETDGVITASGYDDFIGGRNKQKMKMSFDLKLEFKEGRYKYTITRIQYTPYPDANNPTQITVNAETWYDEYRLLVGKGKETSTNAKMYYQIFMTTDRDITTFIDKMKAGMQQEAKTGDDW
ncbi:MAG: DUF4468 domain-containing protein [Bacteroidota bacterium]